MTTIDAIQMVLGITNKLIYNTTLDNNTVKVLDLKSPSES
jgi:hypothetical protein